MISLVNIYIFNFNQNQIS